ncbi:MAG: metallophosphoesterase [Verrucomicrobiota bacterium]
MNASRLAIFLVIVLSVWTAMHLYVFWRVASVPFITGYISRRTLVWLAVGLWTIYPLARILGARHWHKVAAPLEFVGAIWIGLLFLALSLLLIVEVVTAGGFLWSNSAPVLRGWALVMAGVLGVIALAQGLRVPVVQDYEVRLTGLPKEREGMVLIALSDLHLGTMLGKDWLANVIQQVDALKPDVVLVVGDLVDGNVGHVEPLLPVLKTLRAPHGVWAVTGNHEFYAGLERSVQLMEAAGFTVLRDRAVEVLPGLVVAGVDDLQTPRTEANRKPFERALSGRPPGATMLLSHSPSQFETAAAAGVGLMLSGHTHNGQLWPFNYLVRLAHPLVGGRYNVEGMTVIVGRGTGTWGPRMRLWQPGEIMRIRLKSD